MDREWLYEPERWIHDTALDLECKIYGHAPVQADGKLKGHPLYFRARWATWSFTLCVNAEIDPSCLSVWDEQGFFSEGEYEGYRLWGNYGSTREASFMPYEAVENLIRECSFKFLEGKGSNKMDGTLEIETNYSDLK